MKTIKKHQTNINV